MICRFEKGALIRLFLVLLPKQPRCEYGVVFMVDGCDSFGDCADDLAEVAGQLVVSGLVEKGQQLWHQRSGTIAAALKKQIVDDMAFAGEYFHGFVG